MSYGQRSKKYDWFKQSSNKEKRTARQKAKTFWKFLRIFIYFSLFFFSMYGCVQSFMIKTENFTGKGFEIYASQNEVSPHITKFTLDEKDVSKFNENEKTSVGDAKKVFLATASVDNNLYIHSSVKDNKDQFILPQVRETISGQNENGDLKMTDAWQGINESFVIDSSLEELKSQSKIHKFDQDGNFAVLSSLAKKYNLGGKTDLDSLKDIKFWVAKKEDDQTVYNQVGIGLYRTDLNKKPITIIDDDSYNQSHPRNLLRIAFLNHFFYNNPFYDEFIKIDPQTISNHSDPIEKKRQIENFHILQKQSYTQLLGYVGIDPSNDKNYDSINNKFVMLDDFMPIIGYSLSDYRPIISWGDAWTLGPFYGLFVFPIGKLFTLIVGAMPLMAGWEALLAIVTIVFVTRIFAFLVSFKATMQQTKTQEMQAKKAIIDAKYAPYQGNKQMENRKKQEQAELYRKMNINPLSAISSLFVMMPIFLAIWRVIGAVQQIKTTIWLGINFSATSWQELFAGHFQYLPLIIVAGGTQLLSQLFPRLLTRKRDKLKVNIYQKAAMKKNNKTQNIVLGVMVFMAIIFSAGIQIYWIVGGVWRIIEVYITHKVLNQKKRVASQKKKDTIILS